MGDHAAKQAAYAQKRRQHAGLREMPLRLYRVTFADGQQVEERCIGLSQIAAQWPDAKRVEWMADTKGPFW